MHSYVSRLMTELIIKKFPEKKAGQGYSVCMYFLYTFGSYFGKLPAARLTEIPEQCVYRHCHCSSTLLHFMYILKISSLSLSCSVGIKPVKRARCIIVTYDGTPRDFDNARME